MNVWFIGIITVFAVIAALMFAFGVMCGGVGIMWAVYGCMTESPRDRFVVGIDFGQHYNKCLERVVDATETLVDITKQTTEV